MLCLPKTVIAERTSFSVMPGDDATDGVDRKVGGRWCTSTNIVVALGCLVAVHAGVCKKSRLLLTVGRFRFGSTSKQTLRAHVYRPGDRLIIVFLSLALAYVGRGVHFSPRCHVTRLLGGADGGRPIHRIALFRLVLVRDEQPRPHQHYAC